jgi:hypothetical protein
MGTRFKQDNYVSVEDIELIRSDEEGDARVKLMVSQKTSYKNRVPLLPEFSSPLPIDLPFLEREIPIEFPQGIFKKAPQREQILELKLVDSDGTRLEEPSTATLTIMPISEEEELIVSSTSSKSDSALNQVMSELKKIGTRLTILEKQMKGEASTNKTQASQIKSIQSQLETHQSIDEWGTVSQVVDNKGIAQENSNIKLMGDEATIKVKLPPLPPCQPMTVVRTIPSQPTLRWDVWWECPTNSAEQPQTPGWTKLTELLNGWVHTYTVKPETGWYEVMYKLEGERVLFRGHATTTQPNIGFEGSNKTSIIARLPAAISPSRKINIRATGYTSQQGKTDVDLFIMPDVAGAIMWMEGIGISQMQDFGFDEVEYSVP